MGGGGGQAGWVSGEVEWNGGEGEGWWGGGAGEGVGRVLEEALAAQPSRRR